METTATIEVQAVHVPADAVDGDLPEPDSEELFDIRSILDGVPEDDVRIRSDPDAIELLADVEPEAVASALADVLEADVAADDVVRSPTEATMDETRSAVTDRLARLGSPSERASTSSDAAETSANSSETSSDASETSADATETSAAVADDASEVSVERTGDATLRATVPGVVDADAVRDALSVREARVAAHYPADTSRGYEREPLVTAADVADLSEPATDQRGQWYLQVEVEDDASEQFASVLEQTGFTTDGVQACGQGTEPGPEEYCIVTVVDDTVVFSGSLARDLAENVQSGEFAENSAFRVIAGSSEELQDVEYGLVASLPGPVEVRDVESSPVETGSDEDDGESPSEALPGPGLGGALASLALVAAVLARRVGLDDRSAERDR